MKKKFVCQLLALSMTAVMAVPQAGLPVFAASAANTQQAQLKEEAKVGTEITQLKGSTSWMTGTLEKIVLSEITSDSAYCKAITGISVNGVDYVADWNEEDDTLVYSAGWLGMTIYSGAFKEGENTIVIKADGYLDKTILFTKAENECTFVSQSDGNGGQEPEVLDKTALTEKLEEAKALIQGDKSDEEWEDLQSAITAAEHTLSVATTQASLNTALEDLTKALEKFTTGLTAPTVTAVAYDGNELTIKEINHYSDDANWKAYGQSISGVTVNGTEYKEYTNDDDPKSVYSLSVLHGLTIGSGKFTEGRNAIVIKAKGYKDKTVVFAKSGDTCVLISQTDGDSEPVTPSQPTIKDPTEDGVYTLTFKTTKTDSEGDSMLGSFFAAKAKLQVKDGKMTLTMLNTGSARMMLDFTIGKDGTYPTAEKKGYGEADAQGSYTAYEYSMEISNLSEVHSAAALVTMMGGSEADKGNYDKYMKANISFASLAKGWKGYTDEVSGERKLINKLIEQGYDLNDDGEISADELAAISESVDLSNCGLTDVSLLKGLTDKVTSLDLSENQITSLPDGLLDHMTALSSFYADSNYIEELPENFFANNKNLQWVSMRANKLKKINKSDFAGLTELKYLELDNNQIETIAKGAFDGDAALDQFGLSGNFLESLPEGLFKDAGASMTFLNISGNMFETLPSAISDAVKLKKLIAYNNVLTSITDVDFGKMADLTEINFMKNYIAEIKDGTFAKNSHLLSVDLHDNQLTNLSGSVFADTFENSRGDGKLQKLDITLNNIRVVDPALMKKCDTSINKFYPQKTALSLTLKKESDTQISWSQDLSMLDLVFWFDQTVSDEQRELETPEDYRAMLEKNGWKGKTITEILLAKNDSYDWDVITEVQKKNADGSWTTVSDNTVTREAEALTGSFKVTDKGVYRIMKMVNTTLNGSKQYRFTAYSNVIDLSANSGNNNNNNNNNTNGNNNSNNNNSNTDNGTNGNQSPGTQTVSKPAKVTKLTVTSKKKKVTLKWKKNSKATGYEIYRATKKNGKYKKIKTIKKASAVTFTDSKVKKGKTYYYKVRAYKTVKGNKANGKFSAVRKVKIKK